MTAVILGVVPTAVPVWIRWLSSRQKALHVATALESSSSRDDDDDEGVSPSAASRKQTTDRKQSPKSSSEKTNEDGVALAIGTRVSVYWEGDDEYFVGTVTKAEIRGKRRPKLKHYIEYDDGEGEWYLHGEVTTEDVVTDPGKRRAFLNNLDVSK